MRTWCGSRINDTTLPNSRRYILGDGSQSVRAESSPTDGGFARSALDDLEQPPVLYYLAAHKGANPLAALTEAYQSGLPGLRRAGRDRPGAGVPAPRPTAEASARAARAGPGRCRCRRRRGDQVRNEMSEQRTDSYPHAACGGDS
jgi:hypothetical protein